MSHPIVFRRPAREEYIEAIEWYNDQEDGLGLELEAEVQRVLAVIAATPKRYPIVLLDTREAVVDRFPYSVYYRFRHGRVIIVSVFHASRDPLIWQNRI